MHLDVERAGGPDAEGHAFVGPQAVEGVRSHFADKALLSVKGVTEDGQLIGVLRFKIKDSAAVTAQ